MSIRQRETNVHVNIKWARALKNMLDATPKTSLFILHRADGRPCFSEKDDKRLGKEWRAHAQSVGIKGLHFDDLRGAVIALLTQAEASTAQVCAMIGHSLASATEILEQYLAKTSLLSDVAIRLFENASETEFADRLQTKTTEVHR